MGKRRIFTVGFDLPGDDFEYIEFDSDQTLLDADIILFEPSLGKYSSGEHYNGKPLLYESSSFTAYKRLQHWRSEIISAVSAGKFIIVYITKPIECYRYTGEKQHSGTGRSRATTNIVAPISSYEAIPWLTSMVAKSGTEVRLEKDAAFLASYWKEFSEYSRYEAEIIGKDLKVLLKSRSGDMIIGAYFPAKRGSLLFLPPLRYDEGKFVRYDEKKNESLWTKTALMFKHKLATSLCALDDSRRKSTQTTPPPTWVSGSEYRLSIENELEAKIAAINEQVTKLYTKKTELESCLCDAGDLRCLLYEQGHALENVILETLKLFGFQAKQFDDGESEFDAIFTSPEGRCLGEAEGKDNSAVHIGKLDQLMRNLQEDYSHDDVTDYAKGVLFGNAFRLSSLSERSEFFTAKCQTAALRGKIALVRTPDMFLPAKYLKEHPTDTNYAQQCRESIFHAEGEIVKFPLPPTSEMSTEIKEAK